MTTTKLYACIIALAALGGATRAGAETLWGADSTLFTIVDIGGWAALVVFAAYASHTIGYRKAKDAYQKKIDNLTHLMTKMQLPPPKAFTEGRKIGARDMRHRAAELVALHWPKLGDRRGTTAQITAVQQAILDEPPAVVREWAEANQEGQ